MINVGLIDDEKQSLINFEILLEKYAKDVNILFKESDPEIAIEKIADHKPELIFLDIQMPKLNGFEMLAKIYPREFEVIFVTAFDQYALKALKISAMDYLLKPIDIVELSSAVEKYRNRKSLHFNWQFQLLFDQIKAKNLNERIALPTQDSIELVNINAILYCKSANNYTWFNLQNGTKILVSKTLKEYERLFPDHQFIRIHQSYLVNIKHIQSISKKDGFSVIISNGDNIPVSQTKKKVVLKALKV